MRPSWCAPPPTRPRRPPRARARRRSWPTGPAAPIRPLSYTAISAYERCGYRFYIERVLGLPARERSGDGAAAREQRFGFGSAVHALLEWSAARRWLEPSEELCERLMRAEGVEPTPETLERALAMTGGWTDRISAARSAAAGTTLRAEVPLLLALGGSVLRGSIDLLVGDARRAAAGGRLQDRPPRRGDTGGAGGQLRDPASVYALAAAEATGADRGRVAYVFLERPEEPAVTELGAGRASRAPASGWRRWSARIGAGEFEVTSTPDWPLCHDCPARRRLCSGPAAAPEEAQPEASPA